MEYAPYTLRNLIVQDVGIDSCIAPYGSSMLS